ncbi:hypothetical protein D8S78_03340 [Natrialba swarupiae]|nr:hypothetical protein [Natrialba swarupiae]
MANNTTSGSYRVDGSSIEVIRMAESDDTTAYWAESVYYPAPGGLDRVPEFDTLSLGAVDRVGVAHEWKVTVATSVSS